MAADMSTSRQARSIASRKRFLMNITFAMRCRVESQNSKFVIFFECRAQQTIKIPNLILSLFKSNTCEHGYDVEDTPESERLRLMQAKSMFYSRPGIISGLLNAFLPIE